MSEALPPLPEPDWTESRPTNPPRIAARWFGEAKMREYGALCARQERERCVEACKSKLDDKEEARAERASHQAAGTEDEASRLRHWATVSTYNAGIRRCIAAILSALEDKK
jgi:hypothetical protein